MSIEFDAGGWCNDHRIGRWCKNNGREICVEECGLEGQFRHLKPRDLSPGESGPAMPPMADLCDLDHHLVRGVFYLAIHYQSEEATGDGEVHQHSPHSRHRQQIESKVMLTSDEVSERLERIRDEQEHTTSTHAKYNGKVGGKRQQIAGNVAVEQN